MFKMDLSEMDRLKEMLFRSSADADEALYIIKRLRNETGDDILLKAYPNYEVIADELIVAETAVNHLKETIFDLGKTVSEAAELCHESEEQKTDTVIGNN